MIYLASPYTHPNKAVRQERFEKAQHITMLLIGGGHNVFSPIVYTHQFAAMGMGVDWNAWKKFDKEMISICDEMYVLMIDGCQNSKGIQAETALAKKLGKPITYYSENV